MIANCDFFCLAVQMKNIDGTEIVDKDFVQRACRLLEVPVFICRIIHLSFHN